MNYVSVFSSIIGAGLRQKFAAILCGGFAGCTAAESGHVGTARIFSEKADKNTISSGIFPKYLQGDRIVSIPLAADDEMRIGYLLNKDRELSALGRVYIDALMRYRPD